MKSTIKFLTMLLIVVLFTQCEETKDPDPIVEVDPCEEFSEAAGMEGASIKLGSFKAEVADLIENMEAMSTRGGEANPSDFATAGELDPTDADSCNKVGKLVKGATYAANWGGWNGFGVKLAEPLTAAEFNSFGDRAATEANPPAKKVKVDVYYDGVMPASGDFLFRLHVGNEPKYQFPAGRSQFFEGKITKKGEWHTVTFDVVYGAAAEIDATVGDGDTDYFEFLPGAGFAQEGTFYVDNFRVE